MQQDTLQNPTAINNELSQSYKIQGTVQRAVTNTPSGKMTFKVNKITVHSAKKHSKVKIKNNIKRRAVPSLYIARYNTIKIIIVPK